MPKGHLLIKLFVLAGINIFQSKLTVRFSFLTLHFNQQSKKTIDRCTACLYGMFSRIILLSRKLTVRSFPKASAKVRQIFKPANYSKDFFEKSREKATNRQKHEHIYKILNIYVKKCRFYNRLETSFTNYTYFILYN